MPMYRVTIRVDIDPVDEGAPPFPSEVKDVIFQLADQADRDDRDDETPLETDVGDYRVEYLLRGVRPKPRLQPGGNSDTTTYTLDVECW